VAPRRVLVIVLAVVVLAWSLAPAARAAILLARRTANPNLSEMTDGLNLPTESVQFSATDGVRLAGTFIDASSPRGTVVLVHGFKTYRTEMFGHARFLHDAGYAVLAYDGRGCAASDGVFGVGATEDRDIIGAVSYVKTRGGPAARHIAVLGISLGAGDALLAAAEDDRIEAVIADSSWADEQVQLERMGSIPIGPLSIPVLPYEAALVDALIAGRLEDARPVEVIDRIAPRATMLIYSMDDTNSTTSPVDAERLFASARPPKQVWRVPTGGHAGALHFHPDEYRDRVLAFLAETLR
jgi:pimeloyl-ACP methyl ester carboxylesterase